MMQFVILILIINAVFGIQLQGENNFTPEMEPLQPISDLAQEMVNSVRNLTIKYSLKTKQNDHMDCLKLI